MAQSNVRQPSIERLSTILEDLHTGALRIPPFQRDFEWTGEQRLGLCSSVRLGLPTGALMEWRTTRNLSAESPIGPYPLPPTHGAATPYRYLLDGRQRITTLYAALAAGFWTREGKEPPISAESMAPDGTPWSIVFDLEKQDFAFAPQREQPGIGNMFSLVAPPEPDRLLPLAVLMDDTAYDDWRGRASLSREYNNRARALRSAFQDYYIPVVPLVTDDISVVTLTFKRVNSGGTPMGDADMTRALAWSEGFDLREHIDAVREEMKPHGWGDLDEDALLKAIAAVAGVEPIEVDPEKLAEKIKSSPGLVRVAGERVLDAVRLLGDRLGIKGPGSLPYAQVLVFVVRALDLGKGELREEQRQKLGAWASEICLDARFGGAPPHMIRADFRALAYRLGLPHEEPARPRDEKRVKAKECWVFSMAWARSRGTALVLAAQEPRGEDGVPLLEPHGLVAKGTVNVGMLLASGAEGLPRLSHKGVFNDKRLQVALRSPANRVVCPPEELPKLRERLFNPSCPESILRSHLIDAEAHAALLRQDFEGFFERRRDAIIDAELSWVRARGGEVEILREQRSYAQG